MPHRERPSRSAPSDLRAENWHGSSVDAPRAGATLSGLGHALSAVLEQADLREVLRKSVQIGALTGSVALPRQIAAAPSQSFALHGLQGVVDLVGGPVPGSQAFALTLPVEQAAALVDRLLGGDGQPGIAARVGELADAECGVLAYLAARCCAVLGGALGQELRVADVSCLRGEALAARWPGAIVWPMRLTCVDPPADPPPASPTSRRAAAPPGQALTLDVCLLFAEPSCCPALSVQGSLLLFDEPAEDALAALQEGDLLVSDRWQLSATTRGLEGVVELQMAGCDERLVANLTGGQLRVADSGPARAGGPRSEGRLALRLATIELAFAELARLVSGGQLVLAEQALDEPLLLRAGEPIAGGELVQHDGEIGLLVSRLHSTR